MLQRIMIVAPDEKPAPFPAREIIEDDTVETLKIRKEVIKRNESELRFPGLRQSPTAMAMNGRIRC